GLGDLAERGRLPEILPKQIASRNVRDSELPTEPLRLCALAGAGSAEEHNIEARRRRRHRWLRRRSWRCPKNRGKLLDGGKAGGTGCERLDRLHKAVGDRGNRAGSRNDEQFPEACIMCQDRLRDSMEDPQPCARRLRRVIRPPVELPATPVTASRQSRGPGARGIGRLAI